MQTGSHQHVGIRLRPHAVIGTVAFHIVIIGFILRISPLFKFTGGQRNSFIQHGGHHIDERHWAITPWNSSGRSFTATPISIPPALPPCRSRAADRRTLGKQRVTDVQIVVEGIFLTQEFTVFIPLLTQLAAAADVGDGVDKAAVEQAQPAGAEIGIDTLAI